MSTLLSIGILLITLLSMFNARTDFRIYFRSGMLAYLCQAASDIVGILFFWLLYLMLTQSDVLAVFCNTERCGELIYRLWLGLFVVATLLHLLYYAFIFTKESGLSKEIFKNTSYWQRMTGNIPVVEWEKRPPPSLKKKTSIIIGISLMTIGSLMSILIAMSSLFHFFMIFFIISVSALILGLLLIIFSIAFLEKENKG